MIDILKTEQYPDLNWSSPYAHEVDGDPASTFGITELRLGPTQYELDLDHRLLVRPLIYPVIHSRVRFGRPKAPAFALHSAAEHPFELTDAQRINAAVDTVRAVLTNIHQLETAEAVEKSGNALIGALRVNVGLGSQEHLEDIGIIEELLNRYKRNTSIDRILTHARRLQDLGIPYFYEGALPASPKCINWTTNELIQFFETGDCPPLPGQDFLI